MYKKINSNIINRDYQMLYSLGKGYVDGGIHLKDATNQDYVLNISESKGTDSLDQRIHAFGDQDPNKKLMVPIRVVAAIAEYNDYDLDKVKVEKVSKKIRLVCLYRKKVQELLGVAQSEEQQDQLLGEMGDIKTKIKLLLVGEDIGVFLKSISNAYRDYISSFGADDQFWSLAQKGLSLGSEANKEQILSKLSEVGYFDRVLDLESYLRKGELENLGSIGTVF